jgi:DNA-directed RNA polymerase subunit omega
MTDYEEFKAHGLTSQAAVAAVGNRYDLVLIASRRTRELSRGGVSLVPSRHGPALTALKEIEAGKVGREYLLKDPDIAPRRRTWSKQ